MSYGKLRPHPMMMSLGAYRSCEARWAALVPLDNMTHESILEWVGDDGLRSITINMIATSASNVQSKQASRLLSRGLLATGSPF